MQREQNRDKRGDRKEGGDEGRFGGRQKERESHESGGGDRKRRDEKWRTGVWRRGEWGKNWNLDCLEQGFSAFSLSLLN